MDNMAFRRFKNTDLAPKKEVSGKPLRDKQGRPIKAKKKSHLITEYAQPPELIVEYANCTLFPEGSHKAENGWEILPEDQFLIEIAKNKEHIDAFMEARLKLSKIIQAGAKVEEISQKARDRENHREFEEFKRWKESKRLQKDEVRGKK